jgi:3-oxoacyl-[acyl-carrier-protein] synthase-3
MTNRIRRVRVIGTGSFLPNEPVPNDRIDDVLGHVNEAPERVQHFLRTVGKRMVDGSGVESRHFAVDPETNSLTHSIASQGAVAARAALEMAGKTADEVDLLLISSSTFDRGTPPTSAVLQELLGIETCAEMEVHSNCSGIGKCMQIAYDTMRVGRYKTALVVYSQLSSTYLRSSYYNQSKMTKTQGMLRYILADGAGAVVLEASDAPRTEPLTGELLGTYVESIGGKRAPAMTCGGGAEDVMSGRRPLESMYEEGRHHLDQDFAAVGRYAGPFLFDGMMRMFDTLGVGPSDVDHYVWSIPTMQLYNDHVPKYIEQLGIRPEQLKFRAAKCGYCGGASLLIHFDEMVRSGELQRGQTAVVYSVESSKWMSAGFFLRW